MTAMPEHDSNTPPSRMFKLRHYLVTMMLLLASPAVSSAVALCCVPVFGTRSKVIKPVFYPVLFLGITSIFAVIATLVFGREPMGEVIKGLKFTFMGLSLMAGSFLVLDKKKIHWAALVIGFILGNLVFLDKFLPGTLPEALRPPTSNNSAILAFFLCLIVVERLSIWYRIYVICFLLVVANALDSRFLFVLSPLLLLRQPISLSFFQFMSLLTLVGGLLLWMQSIGLWGTWSDLVRLQLYAVSIELFLTDGIDLIASGEELFINNLNLGLPLYVSTRLELLHAHNAFIQVLGSYGLLAAMSFTAALASLVKSSIRLGLWSLRNQLAFIIVLMIIETVISDSRILYVMFVFVGLQLGSASQSKVQIPNSYG